jgi:hypothetical protein
LAIVVTLILASSMATATITVNAHDPPWTIPTYAYITVSPNPVGLGQDAFVVMWLDKVPPTAGGSGGDRWGNYTVTVTKPDGNTQKLGPFLSDPTSSAYTRYVPDQVGLYTFDFSFPGQVASLYNPETGEPGPADALARGGGAYINDTFTGSTASTTLHVQQEPVTEPPTYPLPTEYWSRPIEGQNTAWTNIASNWLGQVFSRDSIIGIQPDGSAPNTSHIMWTKPIQFGGIVGGNSTVVSASGYYSGLTYEMRFTDPLIMQGRLYYSIPLGNNPKGGGYACVDLLTGETIWQNDTILPTFGQLYDFESPNQHGVVGSGMLWEIVGTRWNAYDPFTGKWLFSLTSVPSGTSITGEDGSIDTYVLNSTAGWLAMWNNTAAQDELLGTSGTNQWQWRPIGKVIDASNAYSWNISTPSEINFPGSAIVKIVPNDLLLGRGPLAGVGGFGTPDPYTIWAVSLKPETKGQLLWIKNYPAPEGNVTRTFGPVDLVNRVFALTDKETMQWIGYDLDSGNQLWTQTPSKSALDYYGTPSYSAYGNLYFSGYGGVLYCFSMKDGTIQWTYGNGGSGNSTFSAHETPWGNYPLFISTIADGKVYVCSGEHSPNVPLYKGSRIRCINAYNGQEIWTMLGWGGSPSYYERMAFPIADGYMVYLNIYDMQLYCVGKGPSATTVTAPDIGVPLGTSLLIKGTVTDASEGAKASPAISDSSMSQWMEYLYMQKPKPTNATGVPVTITILDPNNNLHEISAIATDADGIFGTEYSPPVPGIYKVTAAFEGSNAYYGSHAETMFVVSSGPSAAQTQLASPVISEAPQPTSATPTTTYVAMGAAVVVIVAAAAVLIFSKRK